VGVHRTRGGSRNRHAPRSATPSFCARWTRRVGSAVERPSSSGHRAR
jgi:hypothetical protein